MRGGRAHGFIVTKVGSSSVVVLSQGIRRGWKRMEREQGVPLSKHSHAVRGLFQLFYEILIKMTSIKQYSPLLNSTEVSYAASFDQLTDQA